MITPCRNLGLRKCLHFRPGSVESVAPCPGSSRQFQLQGPSSEGSPSARMVLSCAEPGWIQFKRGAKVPGAAQALRNQIYIQAAIGLIDPKLRQGQYASLVMALSKYLDSGHHKLPRCLPILQTLYQTLNFAPKLPTSGCHWPHLAYLRSDTTALGAMK